MVALRLVTLDARTAGGDRHALARRIAEARADVACVHHAPSLLRWRSICAALGREAGLVTVTGGRTGGGALLLSTLGVTLGQTRDLTFGAGHGLRPPGAAVASLSRLDHPFVLAGARLDPDRARQGGQVAELQRAVDRVDPARPPAILCVCDAGSAAAVTLQDGRTAAGSGVFVDPRITVSRQAGGVLELTLPG